MFVSKAKYKELEEKYEFLLREIEDNRNYLNCLLDDLDAGVYDKHGDKKLEYFLEDLDIKACVDDYDCILQTIERWDK